eukprot:sb/3466817/
MKPGNGESTPAPAPIIGPAPAPIIGPQPPPPPPPETPKAVSSIGTFTPPRPPTEIGHAAKPLIGPTGPPPKPIIGPPSGPTRNVIPAPPPPRVQSPVISRSSIFSKPTIHSPPLMPSPPNPMMTAAQRGPSLISYGKPPLMGTPVSLAAALSVSHQVMRTHNSIVTSQPLTSSPLAPTFLPHHQGHVASFPSFTSFPLLRAAAQQAMIRPSLVFPMEGVPVSTAAGIVVSTAPSPVGIGVGGIIGTQHIGGGGIIGGGLAALGEAYSPGNSDESGGEDEPTPQIGVVRVCAPVRYSAAPSTSETDPASASPVCNITDMSDN